MPGIIDTIETFKVMITCKHTIYWVFVFFVLLITNPINAGACDICGCGSGSNYVGILPEFTKRVAGMRYRYNQLQTHLNRNGTSYLTTKEQYQVAELWGAIQSGKKIRFMATIPYAMNKKTNSEKSIYQQGLGDITLLSNYQLIQTRKQGAANHLWIHSLWLGGGIKLPTGKYEPANKEQANFFQTGSGSIDFLLQAMYDLRKQDIGINFNALYKINTRNQQGYLYGNRLSASAQLYHKWKIGKDANLSPNAGVLFETSGLDYNEEVSVFASGGNLLLASGGIEFTSKHWIAGASLQDPVSQKIANDFAKSGLRFMLHAGIIF